MLKFAGRAEDGSVLLAVILFEGNLENLYTRPDPICFDVAELVPEWAGTWCFIAGGTPPREAIRLWCLARGIQNALMIGIDEAGVADLRAGTPAVFPVQQFGAPDTWRGELLLGYAPTEHDAFETYAQFIGPHTTVRRQTGGL